jgi:hypothetical protein
VGIYLARGYLLDDVGADPPPPSLRASTGVYYMPSSVQVISAAPPINMKSWTMKSEG